MPVTFVPIAKPIVTEPEPLPELVIVPVLLTDAVDSVMPLSRVLLLLRVRFPDPVMPPEWVKRAAPLLARVSPPAPSVVAPERVRLEVELFWLTPVTLVPMGALIDTLPVPLPELVIVPVLLAEAVEIVMPLAVEPSFLRIRLPVPVMPPERVRVPF